MNTERLLLDTDQKGNLKGLPKFPPNKQVEVIYLIIDKPEQKNCACRVPHRDIAGKMRIMGNIFDTASEKDWNLPTSPIGVRSCLATFSLRQGTGC